MESFACSPAMLRARLSKTGEIEDLALVDIGRPRRLKHALELANIPGQHVADLKNLT